MNLTKKFIYHDNERIGIPIGNYTSQYFANIYLNELDHFIKEKMKIKYYVRYMDDFILLLENKEKCQEVLQKIKKIFRYKIKTKIKQKNKLF